MTGQIVVVTKDDFGLQVWCEGVTLTERTVAGGLLPAKGFFGEGILGHQGRIAHGAPVRRLFPELAEDMKLGEVRIVRLTWENVVKEP